MLKNEGSISMFITPALAQSAAPGGAGDILSSLAPIIILVIIFWFLIFRPQQKRAKAHQAMLAAVVRGDTVVTNGGLVGKVTKVVDGDDLEIEVSKGVKVKIVRTMLADVRSKPEAVSAKTDK